LQRRNSVLVKVPAKPIRVSIMFSVSVVIPCRNEEAAVPHILRSIDLLTQRMSIDCTILIIDDGSEDSTVSVARRIGQQLARTGLRIQVISLATGSGKDAAILCGLNSVEKDSGIVAVMDGDGQHPVETLELLLDRAGDGALVAVAEPRNAPGGSFFRRKTHDLGKIFLSKQSVQTDFSVIQTDYLPDVVSMMRTGDAYRDALTWLAVPITTVEYDVQPRIDRGKSRFTLTGFITLGSRRALSKGREIVIVLTLLRILTIIGCAIVAGALYFLGALTWPIAILLILILLLVSALSEIFVVFVLLSVYARGTPRPRYQVLKTSPDVQGDGAFIEQ
jgi:glycosyltransferase involved in cell wall biosynthesis